MRFTAATVVSLLAGSAIAAPTDMSAETKAGISADMSTEAASTTNMRLADMFSDRQIAVIKVLSEHQQELGMNQEEKEIMDTFIAALNENARMNVKRQTTTVTNTTALGNLGSAIDALNAVNSQAANAALGAATAVTSAATTAAGTGGSTADFLNILKSLLAATTGTTAAATSGLGGLTSGLGGLTGGLGGLTGGLGGLTGLGGLSGLAGLLGLRRGGLLGGILIPGIL